MSSRTSLFASITFVLMGLGASVVATPAFATTTTSTLSPTDDTDVTYERSTLANGSATRLRAGYASGETKEAYAKFTVGTLSAQTSITKATLRLTRDTSLKNTSSVSLWTSTGNKWKESTLTAATRPAHAGLVQKLQPASTAATIDFDVTAVVKAGGTYAFSVTSANGAASFLSKESGTQGPKLVLTIADTPAANPTPSTTPTAMPSATPTVTPSTTPTATPSTTPPGTPTATPTSDPRETQTLSLVNTEREKAGCPAVQFDSRLATSAERHSADMAKRNFFDHINPDGVAPNQRMVAAGFPVKSWGENIAAGYRDATSVTQAWMNSPGHRANILNCGFRYLGVGVVDGGSYGNYWTQNFAS